MQLSIGLGIAVSNSAAALHNFKPFLKSHKAFIHLMLLNFSNVLASYHMVNLCNTMNFYAACSIRKHQSNVSETFLLGVHIRSQDTYKRLLRHNRVARHVTHIVLGKHSRLYH